MSNSLSANINLLKLSRAGVATIKGLKCLVVPIEENDLYVKAGEDGKASVVSLSINLWENKEVSQYGDTHGVKQNFSKVYRENHSEEEIKDKPFLGNARPIKSSIGVAAVEAPVVEPVEEQTDDLPF